MFKQGIYAAIIAGLMMAGTAHAGGASPQTKPASPTMEEAGGMVPEPPVCNTNTQKLHWNGSDWDCIGVGRANSVSGYAKGSVVVPITTSFSGCPSGTTRYITDQYYKSYGASEAGHTHYTCIKN